MLILKYWYFGSIILDYVPTLPNETSASKLRNARYAGWALNEDCKYTSQFVFCFVSSTLKVVSSSNSASRWCHTRYHTIVCGFRMTYAAFHLFKFLEKRYRDVNAQSSLSIYISFFRLEFSQLSIILFTLHWVTKVSPGVSFNCW